MGQSTVHKPLQGADQARRLDDPFSPRVAPSARALAPGVLIDTGSMVTKSAGLLLFRVTEGGVVEVLLAHPGGPFWARKDDGAWSIPKGEYDPSEDALVAARREFREELGLDPPAGDPVPLGERRQPSGKWVTAWALAGDLDVTEAVSNTFEMEWPRGSGTMREFPEVDRVQWMPISRARDKLLKGQVPFLDVLMEVLAEVRTVTEG